MYNSFKLAAHTKVPLTPPTPSLGSTENTKYRSWACDLYVLTADPPLPGGGGGGLEWRWQGCGVL
jgi:hypothetical protein